MILRYNQAPSNLANELANSMQDSLNNSVDNKLSNENLNNNIEKTINSLARSAELFDELKNYKAAEIITKIIEKLAYNNGK